MSDLILIAAQAILISILLLTLAGRLGQTGKYFELVSHFRVQYLIAAACCLAAFTVEQAWFWAVAALACVADGGAALVPYYLLPRRHRATQAGDQLTLRLLLSNVNYTNKNFSALLELVRAEQPDILIAQEATAKWCRALQVLAADYPHHVIVPRGRGAGIALLSRVPVLQSKVVFVERHQRPGILLTMNNGGREFTLLTMHTHAPIRRFHFGYRNALLSAAVSLLRREQSPRPLIVIGDLNTSPWSPHFKELLRATGLRQARKSGFGLLPTWPVWLRLPWLMIPIDHCLVSSEIEVVGMRTGRDVGSDHLPIIVDLAIADAPATRT